MGMITGYKKGFAQCKLDHKWDYHVIDEMQCMNGDHQLLCGRVKRPGGVTFLIGDRNQARIAPVQNLTPEHICYLEDAFQGGPFHRSLVESLPAGRVAV
eukprot:1713353-Heterocapsa_arctica.AAC.1